jgi:8-oxo-dGTP pyrophosphatase MutT (NUDIX family)
MRVREKVVCYVVRDGRLLVLRHLDQEWDESGLQVPAGSIEPGEPPEAAALREAREETGLDGLRLVAEVGETDYDMRPYREEIHRRHVFRLAVDGDVPERWVTTEDDPSEGGDPIRFECYWIPLGQGHVLSGGQGALLGLLATDEPT